MTLSVFISVDMEGIGGITTLRQVWRGADDYGWARAMMTQEANAAVAGAFDAGADQVVVSDSHGDMGNLLPLELDQRADLVQGNPKVPFSMMTGIDAGFSMAAFIGYHAGAGTSAAILDHTYTGFMADVRVNGTSWNETHLNAALAGTLGVPVGLVAGDRACCEQASERLPWVHTAVVKEGFGNQVGRTRSPERSRALVRDGVAAAVRDLDGLQPFTPAAPFTLEIDVINTVVADACTLCPGTERSGPRAIRFVTDDYITLYRCLLTWMKLGQTVAPVYKID